MNKGEKFSKTELHGKATKLKKREICGGLKTKSRLTAKRQKEGVRLRSQQQQMLVNQENRLGVGPPVLVGLKKRIESKEKTSSGQLGSLRSSKVKVSDTVTSRKALKTLEPNLNPNLNPPSPQNQLHYDLQRVLGKDVKYLDHHHSPPPPPPPPPPLPPSADKISARERKLSEVSGDEGGEGCSGVPIKEIGKRLVQGLQVDVIFPHSCYLDNTKMELKKVLKQSNMLGYEDLIRYFTSESVPSQEQMRPTFLTATEPLPPPSTAAISAPMISPNHANMTDLVALNLEVNTSALNIHDRHSPDHTPSRPKDLLDMMDSAPPSSEPRSHDWNATPTRPRMFPHKLY